MSGKKEITLRESSDPTPRTKPRPKPSMIPVPFVYNTSDDGTDENLLILLHGLGDTEVPFGKLGRQLHLPQTATLAIRAPEQVPFLYEQAFQWYMSFDPLGELIDRPNPTSALDLMSRIVEHLTNGCGWPPQRIHFFGFAQGGSVAAEFAIKYWQNEISLLNKSLPTSDTTAVPPPKEHAPRALGSIVSISGPLLSYPTMSRPCPTPFLIFHRPPPAESALPSDAVTALKKGFTSVVEVKMRGEGMPRSREEFEPVMRFWSEHLGRRQMQGLYEVVSGMAAP